MRKTNCIGNRNKFIQSSNFEKNISRCKNVSLIIIKYSVGKIIETQNNFYFSSLHFLLYSSKNEGLHKKNNYMQNIKGMDEKNDTV